MEHELRPSDMARLMSKIEVAGNGCWEFTGARDASGYGVIQLRKVTRKAHRIAYELLAGPIPEGMCVHHECRTRTCCNPNHMSLVYPSDHTLLDPTPAAVNASKTHCIHGHPLEGDNLYVQKATGKRFCRECARRRTLAHYHRTKEKGES